MYVTLGDPTASTLFHTVVAIGCRNGQGKASATAAFPEIWSDFAMPIPGVLTADGREMKYYNPDVTTPTATTAGLVKNADGHCDAWMNLMIDVLAAQGMNSPAATAVKVLPADLAGYASLGIAVNPALKAQGNETPPNQFNFHRVVRYSLISNNALYDPSYGSAFESATPEYGWENTALLAAYYADEGGAFPVYNTVGNLECKFVN